jgi:hypothetical protein
MARAYDPDQVAVCTRDHWQRPANQNQGDATGEVVFTAVGQALSAWEAMEEEIARMFVTLVGGDMSSANPIRRAFGRVESSGTRRNMIFAAAEAYFGRHWDDRNVRLSFGRVLEAVSWASKRRDDVAHGIVKGITLDGTRYGWFLFPANYNTERTRAFWTNDESDPLYFTFTDFRYTSADIRAFAEKFRGLQDVLFQQTGLISKREDGSIPFVDAVTDS